MTTLLSREGVDDPPDATAPLPRLVDQEPAPAHRAGAGRRSWLRLGTLVCLVLAAHLVVGLGLPVPVLRPVAGMVALVLVPGAVILGTMRAHDVGAPERWLYTVGFLLLAVMGTALAIDYLGPELGVQRPLAPAPLAVVSGTLDTALLVWRGRRLAPVPWAASAGWLVRPLTRADLPVVSAVAGLVLAVLGAVRLDNGAGAVVAFGGLALVALALLGLFLTNGSGRRDALVIVLGSAALLLGTSLRSWYVVGHDVLREYFFFELTQQAAHWDIASHPDPYNACLSVTVLPTVIAAFTGLSGVFVFKVLLQLVFALTPAATYLLGRRVVPRKLALTGAVFLVSFPTFWADMPYLVRQEVAFLFLALCLLAATQPRWRHRTRLAVSIAMSGGLVLSHYSTTYILTLTVALGVAVLAVSRVVRRGQRTGPRQPVVMLSLPMLAALAVMAFVWTGPVTHTGRHFEQVATDTVDAFVHPQTTLESSDLRYALLPAASLSPQARLDAYNAQVRKQVRPARAAGQLLPLGPDARHPRAASRPLTPPTALGTRLARATGVDLDTLNETIRGAAGRLLQVFMLVGVLALVLRRRVTAGFSRDLRWLGVGATLALAVEVLSPGLSVEYGVLRAFQQALLILAPAAAVGCYILLTPVGRRLRAVLLPATALTVFVLLTGMAGFALGGSSPQLHLANRGVYYDLYYRTPQDLAGYRWLDGLLDRRVPGRRGPVVSTDQSTWASIALHRRSYAGLDDQVFPSLLQRDAVVMLPSTTMRDGRSAVLYGGDVVPYRYPVGLLEDTKSRVYDNGSVRVYR